MGDNGETRDRKKSKIARGEQDKTRQVHFSFRSCTEFRGNPNPHLVPCYISPHPKNAGRTISDYHSLATRTFYTNDTPPDQRSNLKA